jgi:hypothetical protein
VRSGSAVAISWKLKKAPTNVKLEILDSVGTVLRTFVPDTVRSDTAGAPPGGRRRGGGPFISKDAGLQRINWDLRSQGITSFPGMIFWGAGTSGPAVPAGRYTARLVADGTTLTTPLKVVRNPRLTDVTDADLRGQFAFARKVRDKAEEANQSVIRIRRMKAQLADRLKKSDDAVLRSKADTLLAHASAVEENIYQVRNQSGQDPLNFPIKVNNRLATLLSMSERGDGAPTNNLSEIYEIMNRELKGYTDALAKVWATDLVAVNVELARLKLNPLDPACENANALCGRVP